LTVLGHGVVVRATAHSEERLEVGFGEVSVNRINEHWILDPVAAQHLWNPTHCRVGGITWPA
jgi:hypothetical protein